MNKKGFCVKLTPEEKKKLSEDYILGFDLETLMKKYKCSHGTIYNICRGLYTVKDMKVYNNLVSNFQKCLATELGWVAGIIDGEGYIGISNLRNRGKVRWAGPRIQVTSTTACMQKELARIFCAGEIHLRDNTKMYNQKDTYSWALASSKEVGAFLTVIEPLLIVKKEQATIVKEFSLRRLRGERYTDWESDAISRIHTLNQRGRILDAS